MSALTVENLELSWPDGQNPDGSARMHRVLDQVSLTVEAGELVALVGPSGSGKSSLISVVAGLVTPTGGRVMVDGRDITAMGPEDTARMRRESIGMVFQQANLIPALTAREQLVLPGMFGRLSRAERRARERRADEMLETMGLTEAADRRPHQLSGGQQQRVNIARALMSEPAVMLVDEPTAALDQERSRAVVELLQQMTRRFGVATIMVTHEMELLDLADRKLTLRDGHLTVEHMAASAHGRHREAELAGAGAPWQG